MAEYPLPYQHKKVKDFWQTLGGLRSCTLKMVYMDLIKKIYNPRTQEAESRGLYVKG